MAKRFPRVPPPPEQDARRWTLKMPPVDIGYVNCIYEAYEGMCCLHTLDRKAGVVEVLVMPGFERDFETVLEGLARSIDLTIVEKEQPFRGYPNA